MASNLKMKNHEVSVNAINSTNLFYEGLICR